MKKIFFTIMTLLIVSITSCDEEKIGQTPTDNIPPQPISNVSVESLPGGAKSATNYRKKRISLM